MRAYYQGWKTREQSQPPQHPTTNYTQTDYLNFTMNVSTVHYFLVCSASPPNAATVLIEEKLCSATLPAFAYAANSLAAKPPII